MTGFSGQTALVSGASRGLGFAVGAALAGAGAQVLALARTVGGLEELDDAIGAAGGVKPVLIPMDITDETAVQGLTQPLADRFGHIDLWVHTAVYAPPLSPAEHMDPRDLDRSLATNLAAVERLILAIDPLLRQAQAGRAVFFDDPAADGVHAAYSAAKAGAIALVRAWGQSLARTSRARVSIATPPPMHTAVRGRFHPGEPKDGLAHPRIVAAELLSVLAGGSPDQIAVRAVP